ncbi:NAD-dependent epimerase/dehydratase family protein [Luethyella okanaganae]|uniref:NAD-dependent epimerase/dehydratase family protein n=1 Tax=Luethyella okanaganae TaxID=69372 RepID=A0ABW1VCM2_9MICO
MGILLTGATGYIGSSVLSGLLAAGYEVTALVRTAEKAAQLEGSGATALVGDAGDAELVRRLAVESEGVIHTASARDVDPVFVPAVLDTLAGRDDRFVHTGGIWSFGDNAAITEDSPIAPVALTAWRAPNERLIREASAVNSVVIAPAAVYGHGSGLARLLVDAPRGSGVAPAIRLIGDGAQHWTSVHVDDLAMLYLLAFESASQHDYVIGASGVNPTVRELGEAVAQAAGVVGGVEAETVEASRERLGAGLADALLLDQQASGAHARETFGWKPTAPTLIEELLHGSYAPQPRASLHH